MALTNVQALSTDQTSSGHRDSQSVTWGAVRKLCEDWRAVRERRVRDSRKKGQGESWQPIRTLPGLTWRSTRLKIWRALNTPGQNWTQGHMMVKHLAVNPDAKAQTSALLTRVRLRTSLSLSFLRTWHRARKSLSPQPAVGNRSDLVSHRHLEAFEGHYFAILNSTPDYRIMHCLTRFLKIQRINLCEVLLTAGMFLSGKT